MRRFLARVGSIFMIFISGTLVAAHGNNDHVRGVVTAITPQSITVQTQGNATTVLALSEKTTFQKSGVRAQLTDLKVGDRVVIDVPKGTKEAQLVQFGPPKKAAAAAGHSHEK